MVLPPSLCSMCNGWVGHNNSGSKQAHCWYCCNSCRLHCNHSDSRCWVPVLPNQRRWPCFDQELESHEKTEADALLPFLELEERQTKLEFERKAVVAGMEVRRQSSPLCLEPEGAIRHQQLPLAELWLTREAARGPGARHPPTVATRLSQY